MTGGSIELWDMMMRKYVSKIVLDILLSVLATVGSSYVTYHYILIEKAPGAAVNTTIDPREAVSFEVPAAPTQANAVLAEGPGGSGAVGPVVSADIRTVEQRNDERVGLSSSAKQAEPTNGSARLRATLDDNRISKIPAGPASTRRSVTASPRKPSRAAAEQSLGRSVNPSVDIVRPREIELDKDSSLSTEMRDSHLAGKIWRPISRTALLLLHSLSLASDGQEPERSNSPNGISNASRIDRLME